MINMEKFQSRYYFLEEDYEKIVENNEFNDTKGNDAIIFVGHGSEDVSDKNYEKLQKKYEKAGKSNIFIGTIEGKIQILDILNKKGIFYNEYNIVTFQKTN